MSNETFYLKSGIAVLLSLAAASMMAANLTYSGLVAGLAGLSGFLLLKSVRKSSRRKGRTDRMKISMVVSEVLFEFILFLGAFSSPVIPKYAASITLAAIAFTEILNLEVARKVQKSFDPDIGRTGRVIALAGSLAAYEVNAWYLFYGTLFVFLISIYDSLRLVHRLSNEI